MAEGKKDISRTQPCNSIDNNLVSVLSLVLKNDIVKEFCNELEKPRNVRNEDINIDGV